MSGPRTDPGLPGPRWLGVAAASSGVAGVLALADPTLEALCGVLVALAFLAWVLGRPSTGRGWSAGELAALASLTTGALFYLSAPALLGPFRGVVLAASLAPLAVARPRTGPAR